MQRFSSWRDHQTNSHLPRDYLSIWHSRRIYMKLYPNGWRKR